MNKENTSIRLNKIMRDRNLRQVDILNLSIPYCKKYNVKMNRSDISQYVSGKVEPNQDKLAILGMSLGVSEAWLMGYDVPMERVYSVPNGYQDICENTTVRFKNPQASRIAKYIELLNNDSYIELLEKASQLDNQTLGQIIDIIDKLPKKEK